MDFNEAKWTDRYWPQIKFSFSLLPIWAGYVCINPHLVYRYFMKKTEEMVFLKTVYVWAEISPKHSVTRRLGKYFFHYLAICSQEIVKIIQSAAFFAKSCLTDSLPTSLSKALPKYNFIAPKSLQSELALANKRTIINC